MRNLFRSSLFFRVFSTTTAAILLLFSVMYLLSVPFIQSTVGSIEARATRTVLDNVYEMVEQIHRDLDNTRQSILLARKKELQSVLAVAESRALWLDRQVAAGKLSRERAKRMLLDELRQIKYGRNDYVWASDYRSVLVSHPDPKLNNADFSDKRDMRGNLIVPPMVAGGRASGEGFHSYWWRQLGGDEPIEKLTFYKHLPTFELVIGTGVYLDDIDNVLASRRAVAVEELRHRLRETRLGKTGYAFVVNGRGHVLIHPNPNLEDKNLSGMIEPVTQKPIFPMLVAAADKPEGLRYRWDSPSDPGNYVHEKISWVRHFQEADWYIASSIYGSELDESAVTLRNRVLGVFAITLLLSVILVYVFVKRLVDPLKRLSSAAIRVEQGNLDARCSLSRSDEIGVVAAAFDGMVSRLQDNIGHLDAKVRERTAELEKAYEELKELDQLKSNFLSTVSHELRTPTTSIVGFTKLIRKKLEGAIFPRLAGDDDLARPISQIRENLDIVAAESERLTVLINDVLDSTKLDAGKAEWNSAPIDPAQLLERAADIAAKMAEQKGLALSWEAEPGLPAMMGNESRLLQVLINLVSNAVKFTQAGRISLRAERQDGFILFSVEDTGVGIAPENREKIFDRFRQIGDTLTGKPQGTGLGLSICRQIVDHHGGTIRVESEPGAGSVFRFTVPLSEN